MHTISDKKVIINGMEHKVISVDGLDRVDINNRLHDLNEQISKLKMIQSELVQMRNMIDFEIERMERMESGEVDLFEEMFGSLTTP